MEVIEEAHNSATGGHFGAARTEAVVASQFFWKGLRPMVRHYVQGCEHQQKALLGCQMCFPDAQIVWMLALIASLN
jgi:hypothetical protein